MCLEDPLNPTVKAKIYLEAVNQTIAAQRLPRVGDVVVDGQAYLLDPCSVITARLLSVNGEGMAVIRFGDEDTSPCADVRYDDLIIAYDVVLRVNELARVELRKLGAIFPDEN